MPNNAIKETRVEPYRILDKAAMESYDLEMEYIAQTLLLREKRRKMNNTTQKLQETVCILEKYRNK